MTRAGRRRAERGATLIEVMIAGAVLLVALAGFVGTSRYAATATAVGHRRTATALLRGEVMDRYTVLPRSSLGTLTGVGDWVIDACYDIHALPLPAGRNTAFDTAFTCPTGAYYRSWVAATSNAANVSWSVNLYVERIDMGCTPAQRRSAVGCAAADLLLTD